VVGMRFEPGQGGVGLIPSLSLSETSPLIYDWDASEAQIYAAAPRTNLPGAWQVDPVGVTSVTEEQYVNRAGDGVRTRARVEWSASESGNAYRYVLQASYQGGPWVDVADTRSLYAIHEDVAAGSWTYRVQAISTLGAASVWTSYAVEILALTEPPSELENVTLQTAGGLAIIKWALSPDLDVRYGGRIVIRHCGAPVPLWSSSIALDEVTGNSTIAVVPLMEGTYFVRAVDGSGNLGPLTSLSASGAQAVAFANINTLQADTAFSGSHDGTIAQGGTLRLPVAGGLVAASGTYTFASGLDLGSSRLVRLRAIIHLTSEVIGDTIDARSGLVDSWDNWDSPAGADVSVEMQIRTTTDNPAGSPTWTPWGRLDATELRARGIQARAILTSKDTSVQPVISVLRVQADEVA